MIRTVAAAWCCLLFVLYGDILPAKIAPEGIGERYMGIRIIDQKLLDIQRVGRVKFAEISDLAYDSRTGILYMVGDEGTLYRFQARFSEQNMTLRPLRATRLKKRNGKELKHWKRDSEGMTLDPEGRLLISFEGDVKIAQFEKEGQAFGRMIRRYTLPKVLQDIRHYRSKNKALEALAYHPEYGIIVAPEWPLKRYDKKQHTVYTLGGKRWFFHAEKEARSSVTAMEVMEDGNLLVIERSFTGLFAPFVITLKKVYIEGCKKRCKSRVLAKFNTHDGWDIDNFEGLTKVGKNRYLMVSDNGDHFYQKTLIVYFEVL